MRQSSEVRGRTAGIPAVPASEVLSGAFPGMPKHGEHRWQWSRVRKVDSGVLDHNDGQASPWYGSYRVAAVSDRRGSWHRAYGLLNGGC